MFFFTTAPAPITAPFPRVTPFVITQFEEILVAMIRVHNVILGTNDHIVSNLNRLATEDDRSFSGVDAVSDDNLAIRRCANGCTS
jgi:hypothetical protein